MPLRIAKEKLFPTGVAVDYPIIRKPTGQGKLDTQSLRECSSRSYSFLAPLPKKDCTCFHDQAGKWSHLYHIICSFIWKPHPDRENPAMPGF